MRERGQRVDQDRVEVRIEHSANQTFIIFDALESEVSGCLTVDVGEIPLADAMALAHGIRREAENVVTGPRIIADGGDE